MRLASWCSALCVLLCTSTLLGGCSVLHGRRPVAGHPQAYRGKPSLLARAAAPKAQQTTCQGTDATGLSEARKAELFRQFAEWHGSGESAIAESRPPARSSATLLACSSVAE
jgi:hypothetical protein